MTRLLALGAISAMILALALTSVLVTIVFFLARIRRVLIEIQAPLRSAAEDGGRLAGRLERLQQGSSAAANEVLRAQEDAGSPAARDDRLPRGPARGRGG